MVNNAQTYRGEIYLEMTFFAAGPRPANINRRPSKLAPAERLWRPPQTPPRTPPKDANVQLPASPPRPAAQYLTPDAYMPTAQIPATLKPGSPPRSRPITPTGLGVVYEEISNPGMTQLGSSPPNRPPRTPPQIPAALLPGAASRPGYSPFALSGGLGFANMPEPHIQSIGTSSRPFNATTSQGQLTGFPNSQASTSQQRPSYNPSNIQPSSSAYGTYGPRGSASQLNEDELLARSLASQEEEDKDTGRASQELADAELASLLARNEGIDVNALRSAEQVNLADEEFAKQLARELNSETINANANGNGNGGGGAGRSAHRDADATVTGRQMPGAW